MKEIIGDDYPTYEESVNMTLAEREKDSAYAYMTEVEHEINKQNVERLIKENLELRHRLSCINDEINIISMEIDGSTHEDEIFSNINSIQIACDLNDNASLEWSSEVKSELTKDQIMEMEQQIR